MEKKKGVKKPQHDLTKANEKKNSAGSIIALVAVRKQMCGERLRCDQALLSHVLLHVINTDTLYFIIIIIVIFIIKKCFYLFN